MSKIKVNSQEIGKPRFKALVYGTLSCGKTHFATGIPNAFYIDSENIDQYPKFKKRIKENKGEIKTIYCLEDIISEVKGLLINPRHYKTLIIDSISFPFNELCNSEVERLVKGSKKEIEGTEFGANKAKPTRLIAHLTNLLIRIDMNVIVLAHEKTKYEKNEEVGKMADVPDKMAYALGACIHLRKMGAEIKGLVEKSRYEEIDQGRFLDFTKSGYEELKKAFGEDIFVRETTPVALATPDQLKTFKYLVDLLKVPEDVLGKWLIASKSASCKEMPQDFIQSRIDYMQTKIKAPDQDNDNELETTKETTE